MIETELGKLEGVQIIETDSIELYYKFGSIYDISFFLYYKDEVRFAESRVRVEEDKNIDIQDLIKKNPYSKVTIYSYYFMDYHRDRGDNYPKSVYPHLNNKLNRMKELMITTQRDNKLNELGI